MDPKGIFEALQAKFGEETVFGFQATEQKGHDPFFFVKPEQAHDVAMHLRDDPSLACNYMECLSGVDYPDKNEIHVVVHAFSYRLKHRTVMKVALPRDNPRMKTFCEVWSAANWQERECWDLLGVTFEGHPDLRRIMLPDDWVGHPLRRDYKEQAEYQGIPTTRPNPLELLTVKVPEKPKAAADKAAPAKKEGEAEAKPKPAPKPKAEPKPDEPKVEPEAAEPKAEAKPDEPKAEAKPDEPKAEPKPDEPKAEPKPDEPKAEAKPDEPKAEPKPDEPKAEPKPDEPKAEAKPDEPKVEPKADEPKAEAKPDEPKTDESQ